MPLSAIECHCVPLSAIECHCVQLRAIECLCVPLSAIECHWVPLSAIECLPHQVGIPRQQLAIAKAAPGPRSHALAARQLRRLVWDEAAMLHAPKVSERLADGSVLIVRDRMHPAPITAPEPPITAPQPPGEPLAPSSAARRSGVSFDGAAAAGSEPLCPARRTRGVQIRGPVFAEDA